MTNPSVNRMGLCRVVLTFSSDDITPQVKIYSESEVPERPKSEKRGKEGTYEPGGAFQLHLYGGVWPQDWKIDPSAD